MDYTRNEDRLVSDTPVGAAYNHIYNVEDASIESDEITEPVTLEEVKETYMRLTGFGDDSPGDYDFDDELIEELITEGRLWAEKFTGLHLIPKTLEVVLLNQAGGIEIPGPVTGDIVIKNLDDEVVDADSYSFIGTHFPKLRTTFSDKIKLEYNAGYTRSTIPRGLKGAIKAYVLHAYEHRGDESNDKGFSETAARKARPYRRLSLWQ